MDFSTLPPNHLQQQAQALAIVLKIHTNTI